MLEKIIQLRFHFKSILQNQLRQRSRVRFGAMFLFNPNSAWFILYVTESSEMRADARNDDLDSNTCKRGLVGYSTSQLSNGANGRHDKAVVI